MSSEFSPSEKMDQLELLPSARSKWTVHLKTSAKAYHFIQEIAKRDERRVYYVVSKIVEAYCEENTKIKVI